MPVRHYRLSINNTSGCPFLPIPMGTENRSAKLDNFNLILPTIGNHTKIRHHKPKS